MNLVTLFSKPKVALCFIISYDHVLNKEEIWREWIQPNKDIINVYFFYKDKSKIQSQWILSHIVDPEFKVDTTYLHVVPAYMNLLSFAKKKDPNNQWFCLLTDSCCPIVSPRRFRYLFFENRDSTLLSWRFAWWNPFFHKRANLTLLPTNLHLGNAPWFVIKREDVELCFRFIKEHRKLYDTVCSGGLANESIFAILFKVYGQLAKIKSETTHLTDWSRMSSSTSPYVFREDTDKNRDFIRESLKQNKMAMFLRKVAREFPDDTVRYFLYEYNKKKDLDLTWKEYRMGMSIIKDRRWDWVIGMFVWLVVLLGIYWFFLSCFKES